jgi:acyl-coenzyme A thioesterase PaaI-like protein
MQQRPPRRTTSECRVPSIDRAVPMPESFRSRLSRHGFNLFPAYRGTGGRITYISGDWREIRVRIPLGLRTRNYVGTIFGGSMYGAVDPIYMIMLIRALGPGYVVWDKAAAIRFRRPGRTTLHAHFVLEDAELDAIRAALATQRSVDRVYSIDLADVQGTVHATVEKTIHVRRKEP